MYESSAFNTDTESGFSDALEAPQTDMLRQKRLNQILNSKQEIDERLRKFLGIFITEEDCPSVRVVGGSVVNKSAYKRMHSMAPQKY